MAAIEQAINKALDEVRAIVRDWQPMKDKALALADDRQPPAAGRRRVAQGSTGVPALGR